MHILNFTPNWENACLVHVKISTISALAVKVILSIDSIHPLFGYHDFSCTPLMVNSSSLESLLKFSWNFIEAFLKLSWSSVPIVPQSFPYYSPMIPISFPYCSHIITILFLYCSCSPIVPFLFTYCSPIVSLSLPYHYPILSMSFPYPFPLTLSIKTIQRLADENIKKADQTIEKFNTTSSIIGKISI